MPAGFVRFSMEAITSQNTRLRDVMAGDHVNFGLKGKRLIMSRFSNGVTFATAFREIRNVPGDVLRTPYVFPDATSY